MENYKNAPLYRNNSLYAAEHDELLQYRDSQHANAACKKAIEDAIANHYADDRLNAKAALAEVRECFDDERIRYILAITVRMHDWDGRVSKANKKWADTVEVTPDNDSWGGDKNCYLVIDKAHIGLVDLFVTCFRKETKILEE